MPDNQFENEDRRPAATLELDILDRLPENCFDDLTALAAIVCKTPTAMIGLFDGDRQRFESPVNLEIKEIAVDESFCRYTRLDRDEVFVVEDAAADSRFAGISLVKEAPYARFYAGAPLVSPDGLVFGTLCVLDCEARVLTAEQSNALKLIARQITTQTELHRTARENDRLSGHRRKLLSQTSEGVYSDDFEQQIIAELKQKEEELTKNRHLFDCFMTHSPAMVFMKDDQGRYQFINKPLEKLLRIPLADLRGKTDFLFLSPEHAETVRRNDRAVLKTGESVATVEIIKTPDGIFRSWLIHKFLIVDKDRQRFVGGIAVDVTAQKQMEAELKSAYDAALESVRMKTAFLTNVSHEIRTPMNGVVGMTELLLETPLDPAQRDFADMIRQSADSLLLVINDILDLARIESGKLRLESTDFDLHATIRSAVQIFAERAERKNIEIKTIIETDVPTILRGDANRLRQVLIKIIGNAVKFTEAGAIEVAAKVEKSDARNLTVRFTVTDTGIGIDLRDVKNLFQPFVQADCSTTRQYGGTGLGLIISKQIVEMMDGKITVESEPEKGSSFSFTCRFSTIADAPATTSNTVEKAVDGDGNRDEPAIDARRCSSHAATPDENMPDSTDRDAFPVMVVEDNEVNRFVIMQQLQKIGVAADVANDGQEALEKLEKRRYRLIFMDCQMPRLDGYEATREIRRLEQEKSACGDASPPIAIIALTAHTMEGEREKCLAVGMDDFLTKPAKVKDLTEAINFWSRSV